MTDAVKLKIFNQCGAVFNRETFTEDDLEEGTNSNLVLYERFLTTALHKAMREANWSFLLHPVTLEDDLGEQFGYQRSFKIPATVLRIVAVNKAVKSKVMGNIFLTDGEPDVLVINKTITDDEEDYIPEEFWTLVAYELAFLVFGSYADSNIYNYIVTSYNNIMVSLLKSERSSEVQFWE